MPKRLQVYQIRHDFDANGIANTYSRSLTVRGGRIKQISVRSNAICAFKIVTTNGVLLPGGSIIVDNSIPDGWVYLGSATGFDLGNFDLDVDLELSDPSYEVTVKAFRVSGTNTFFSLYFTVEEDY